LVKISKRTAVPDGLKPSISNPPEPEADSAELKMLTPGAAPSLRPWTVSELAVMVDELICTP
jgi:hypothetical protein